MKRFLSVEGTVVPITPQQYMNLQGLLVATEKENVFEFDSAFAPLVEHLMNQLQNK